MVSEREVLTHAGRVSHDEAMRKAELEYDKFRVKQDDEISLLKLVIEDSHKHGVSLLHELDLKSDEKRVALLKEIFQKTGFHVDIAIDDVELWMKVPLQELPAKDLRPFVQSFTDSFRQLKKDPQAAIDAEPISEIEQEELEAFIPDTYSLCPCASGKKFKFCCQKAFKDIAFAMCAAQDGDLNEALRFMQQAEEKVGRTAEILVLR